MMLANVNIAAQGDKFEGWANLLYILLVLLLPALNQLGRWIRDRSGADKADGKKFAGALPKPPKEVTRPPQTQAVSKPPVAEKVRRLPSAETKSKPGPRKVHKARPAIERPQAPAGGTLEELFGPVLGEVIQRAAGEKRPAARPTPPTRRELPPRPPVRKARPQARPVAERGARRPAPATASAIPQAPPETIPSETITHAEYKPHWTDVKWKRPGVDVHFDGVHGRRDGPLWHIAQMADTSSVMDLRTAVVLSEIIRPPLAIREPEGWGR